MKTTTTEKRDHGFTLIELLVVVLIIGVLAAIAIPVFLSQREKAADAATKSDLKNAATLMETWYVDNQTYAGSDQLADLQASDNVEVDITTATVDGFCLDGTNEGGSDTEYSYNSDEGGLVEEACA